MNLNKISLRGDGEVEVSVQGEGIPLIFITGILGRKEPLHVHQVPFLSQSYRVITYDLRPSVTGDEYNMELLAEDLLDLMNYLQIEQAIICGQSYGALIALQYALAHQDRILALVLANGFAHYSFEHFGLNLTTLLTPLALPATFLLPRSLAKKAGHFFARHHVWVYDEVEDGRPTIDFAMTFLRSAPPGSPLVMPLRIRSVLVFDVRDQLVTIHVPTLVIAGETDTYCSPVWSKDMAAAIPGARFELIRGAGHMCCLSAPDTFNQIIYDFLCSLRLEDGQVASLQANPFIP